MSFSNEHLQELKKFLSFFNTKAESVKYEIEKEIKQFKKVNFQDDIYNKDEVKGWNKN